MSQTPRDTVSGHSKDVEFLFPLGPFSMNESFLIVPEAKRMDLPLLQPKKKICKQWTTLYKMMITALGIQTPTVTSLYSNCLVLVFSINQFHQIMDRDLVIPHPGVHHQKIGDHHPFNRKVNLFHHCSTTHLLLWLYTPNIVLTDLVISFLLFLILSD